jgi:hypothetical protein
MCDLSATQLFGLSSGLSVAQGLAGYGQAQQDAKAQADYNAQLQQMNYHNALAANAAYENNMNLAQLRQTQERAAAIQKLLEAQRLSLQGASRMKAQAASQGVTGPSIQALMRDIEGQTARHRHTVMTNYKATSQQMSEEMKGMRAQALTRVNNRTPIRPVAHPSLMSAGLGIGGNILGHYARYRM